MLAPSPDMAPVEMCLVSAPGKVILHGEHAVVHGKAALAVSLNLRTYLRLQLTSAAEVSISLPNIDTFLSWDISALEQLLSHCKVECRNSTELDTELVRKLREFTAIADGATDTSSLAVLTFLYIYLCVFAHSEVLPSLKVCVWSQLPTGAGLGSSAAYSVCVSAALLTASGTISFPLSKNQHTARWSEQELELINNWAFQGEKIIHGNPSGVDNAVGTWGGFLRYHAGKMTPLSRVPMLRILLTNTKVPRSTKLLVSRVKDRIKQYPSVMMPVLESVDAVSQICESTLVEMAIEGASDKHYSTLEDLIDINQHHLNVMGVGHTSLNKLCQVTLAHSLHSKLTGAGGGGCAVTLLTPKIDELVVQEVMEELKQIGFDCWETSIGAPGVWMHSPTSLKHDILEILTKY
ncbi:mevalonate kinase [Neoarius graeffei]|uniref:mevalonate kinase n=1 Tax=Neoarius graeffei TaxID=443677 RepID=UPI00298CBE71|nr:mevalonate kinase [Neoarius graeffei]